MKKFAHSMKIIIDCAIFFLCDFFANSVYFIRVQSVWDFVGELAPTKTDPKSPWIDPEWFQNWCSRTAKKLKWLQRKTRLGYSKQKIIPIYTWVIPLRSCFLSFCDKNSIFKHLKQLKIVISISFVFRVNKIRGFI